MKNVYLTITINIFFTVLFLLPYTLQAFVIPWHQLHLNESNGEEYYENCTVIEDMQKTHYAFLLHSYPVTYNKSSITTSLNSIQEQLIAFKTELIAQEQKALLAIKEKYCISDTIWQKCMADLHRMKLIYTKSMKQNHAEAIHDPNIPADILEILITLLQQNGINPQSIQISMVSDQKKIDANPTTVAQAVTQSIRLYTSSYNLISYKYIPLIIEVFPQMDKESIQYKIGVCAHEIQHIVQHHGLTDSLLIAYLEYYYHIDETSFKQSAEYHQLSHIQEAQAEILAAIENPKIAEYLKMIRQQSFYPDRLYENHFLHLASINTLWKVHEWIKYFEQNSFPQIKTNLSPLS